MLIGRREPRAGACTRSAGLVALLTALLLGTGLSGPPAPTEADPAPVVAVTELPVALPSRPPPDFVPPPECHAQHAAMLAVQQQIDAHNARPHVFRLLGHLCAEEAAAITDDEDYDPAAEPIDADVPEREVTERPDRARRAECHRSADHARPRTAHDPPPPRAGPLDDLLPELTPDRGQLWTSRSRIRW